MLSDPVSEEDAVQVIEFVLDVGGLDVGEGFDNFVEILAFFVLDCYFVWSIYESPDLGDR